MSSNFTMQDLMLKAAWLRPCIDAALASLKKFPSDFFNPAFGATDPKEASYAGTGVTARISDITSEEFKQFSN